jgi:tetratricopeptide (TPR) repeat protein
MMLDRVVLEEYPNDTGQALWRALREVELWRTAHGNQRGPLFPRDFAGAWGEELIAAAPDPKLREPLERIVAVGNSLAHPRVSEVAEAFRAVSEWAEAQDRYGTALAFMQAVALLVPDDARSAYLTGRLARRRAEYARAESWFYEAISRALEQRDWDTYARTFIGLGNQYNQRGNLPLARRCHERAYRIASKRGVREVRAMAAHDLFVLSMDMGRVREAELYADEARSGYGADHPLLPSLANDVAFFWMEHGHFERAHSVFRAVLPHLKRTRERLLTLGAIARTYGALDNRTGYEDASAQLRGTAAQASTGEGLPFALLSLAQGALSLGEWERAEQTAAEAYRIARERREAQIVLQAETIEEAARRHRRIDLRQATVQAVPITADQKRGDSLANEFVASLAQRAVTI